ncbi:hypothetical protein [Pseudonocardia acidicola]|uniref:Uncharacterized protein n=1 Tax=Pseudonocardia acidicola TaxID=2724939 RepID=A0ABX1SA62_9PSEU|nr:hypothetical protein [Pseudonocardia acidicola]NMH97063.1 hypothetical protein [Pseudonocardia acidicola]
MIDPNVTPQDTWTAADWLHQAAEVLRRIARNATPGPWRWGDRDVDGGVLERHRTTLEHVPVPAAFPAVRPRHDEGEGVLPGLKDPLDEFDAVDSIYPHVHANARWITILTPSIAESLAALLDSLAEDAEQTLKAGGSIDHEPYRSAVTLAKQIVEAAQDWSPTA